MKTRKSQIILIICIVLSAGCFRSQTPLGPSQLNLRDDRNYTFAIYNDQNKLMNHPLKDLNARMKALDQKNLLKDFCNALSFPQDMDKVARCSRLNLSDDSNHITDIYVVSHGWNYTLDESITNYQHYIDLINSKISPSKKFHPYFIFISWPSAARPLTNLARSVVPFGVDNDISKYTSPIDHTLLFFPTVWKQSLNAYENAVGNWSSKYHQGIDCREKWQNKEDSFAEDGRDVPVALILYELLKIKNSRSVKLHLVGHSFGAKLVSHSALLALEWWIKDTYHEQFSEAKGRVKSGEECGDDSNFHWDAFFSWREKSWQDDPQRKFPIESLLLFNPAMNFRELSPFLSFLEEMDPVLFMQFIARKGIVYSNSDYPYGTFFDLAQIPFNTSFSQFYHTLLRGYDSEDKSIPWFKKEAPKVIGVFNQVANGHFTVSLNERTTSSAFIAILKTITYKNTNLHNSTNGIRKIRHLFVDGTGTTRFDHTTKVWVSNRKIYSTNSASDTDLFYKNHETAEVINEWIDFPEWKIDESSLDSGTLTVTIEEGEVKGEDVLGLQNQGEEYQQIGLKDKEVTYVGRKYLNTPKLASLVQKPLQISYLGLVPAYSALYWALSKPFNIISNYWYHLKHNETFQATSGPLEALRQGFNGLHFFLPLDKIYKAFRTDGGVDEDQWGILRSNVPALGRTGLAHADLGILLHPDTKTPYFPTFKGTALVKEYNPDSKERSNSKISAESLCNFSTKLGEVGSPIQISPSLIYSIDASKIFNDKWPPVGAHDDIRSEEIVGCPKIIKLPKREFMLNFIYNFTNGGDPKKVKYTHEEEDVIGHLKSDSNL